MIFDTTEGVEGVNIYGSKDRGVRNGLRWVAVLFCLYIFVRVLLYCSERITILRGSTLALPPRVR